MPFYEYISRTNPARPTYQLLTYTRIVEKSNRSDQTYVVDATEKRISQKDTKTKRLSRQNALLENIRRIEGNNITRDWPNMKILFKQKN